MTRSILLVAVLLTFLCPRFVLAQDDIKARFQQDPAARSTGLHSITGATTTCTNGDAGGFPCSNVDLLSFMTLSDLGGGPGIDTNDIWGWTDPVTGTEYALVGLESGTAFVDLSDPMNPVLIGNLPTHSSSSLWRDIKVYADHAFIVSEASSHGMQVFDLSQLRDVTNPPVTFSETTHFAGVGNSHNIVINEDTGFAYIVGSTFGGQNLCGGGLYMVDIQDPVNPTFAGCYGGDGYTHDAQCVIYNGPDTTHIGKEICFAANEDTVTIVDVTDKSAPVQLSRTGYPQEGYTHQGWITPDQQYYLLDDELDESFFGVNTTTRIWDITDLDAPQLNNTFVNPVGTIDHNQYVVGDHSFQSNYTSGLRILDISDINNPFEAGFFDTVPSSNAVTFLGSWSNYPYFASGIVVVSSIAEGLFVLQPNLDGGPPPSDLVLSLTPESNNIIVPGGGGSFQYDLSLTNNGASSRTVDIWIAIDGPGVSRTLGPVSKTIAAGGGLSRTFVQNIPAGAPAGSYTLSGNAGTFPVAEVSDNFPFEKSATGAPGHQRVQSWSSNLTLARGAKAKAALVPKVIELSPNYPNPFGGATTLRYSLPERAEIKVAVFNQLGRQVRLLVAGTREAGTHTVVWDGTDDSGVRLPSGVYLLRLNTGKQSSVRSTTLLKAP